MNCRSVLPGWILLEALLVLSIASLVAIPLGRTMAAAVRVSAEVGSRLDIQASRAIAAAAILRLTEQGLPPREIVGHLEQRFPSLTFFVEDSVCRVEARD